MLGEDELRVLDEKQAALARLTEFAGGTSLKPNDANPVLERHDQKGLKEPQRIAEVVRRPGVPLRVLFELAGRELSGTESDVLLTAEIELRYAGYLERERETVERMKRMAGFRLPADMPYGELDSISTEARHKLESVMPRTLAQAGRIPGVSPADLQNLVFEVLKRSQPAA
jgi:tRNA uridine 5-carboxymethylaminomethyl modification enzyme